mmetsp:Transcript_40816/g.66189  ORF Transcript_40816/g.66189 Transcript_40816/m.66189 type:complete len:86 (-) Transcript_40816:211-468(-)
MDGPRYCQELTHFLHVSIEQANHGICTPLHSTPLPPATQYTQVSMTFLQLGQGFPPFSHQVKKDLQQLECINPRTFHGPGSQMKH